MEIDCYTLFSLSPGISYIHIGSYIHMVPTDFGIKTPCSVAVLILYSRLML